MLCYFDLEANGLLDTVTKIHCGVFIEAASGKQHIFEGHQMKEMTEFMDTCSMLVAHNGIGYDFPLLKMMLNYEYKGIKIDTALMSRLQRPERKLPYDCPDKGTRPHSLAAFGYRVGRGKVVHEDWTTYTPDMLHRCVEDVEILRLVHGYLKEEGGPSWIAAHQLTHRLFEILHEQEKYGWLVDRTWIDKSIAMLTHWIAKIDSVVVPRLPQVLVIDETKKAGELGWVRKPFLKSGLPSSQVLKWEGESDHVAGPFSRISYRPVNLDSNKETKDWLLREGWIPEAWNYKKENGKLLKVDKKLVRASPKLNGADAFRGVDGKIGRLIAKRVQCKHRRSNLEGWVKIIRDDGRISQGIAGMCTTARLKHRGIVNVPSDGAFFGKWMRKSFISKDGYSIVGVDAAGCQNRMLAARVGDDAFTEILINGDKAKGTAIHQINQQAIADVGITVSYGQAKNLNYAFMFGASDNKLGDIIGENKDTGTRIRDALLSVSTGFSDLVLNLTKEWVSNAKTRLNDWDKKEHYDGWVEGLDGRPIHIESEHQILVYVLQSDEAILMQHALVLLKEWCDAEGWTHGEEYGFVANVHDEFSAEVRDDLTERYLHLGCEAIAEAGRRLKIACPHQGDGMIGKNWMEVH